MEYPRQVTVIQATAVLISTIIGVGVLPLPLFAARAADTGAPLVTLLGILLAFTGLWTVTKLGMRFPNQSIIQYSEVVLGRWPAWLGSILIIGFFSLLTSLAAREFGEVVITSVLRKTPLEVTVIVMLLLATLSSRNNQTTFTYIHHFYLPLIVFPCILIVALSLKNAQLTNLQPLWGNEPHGMLSGMLTIAGLFQGSFIHTIVIPAMRRPEKAMQASVWGMIIAGGLYFSIVTAAVGVFGPEETKLLLWPTLELAKTTALPGNILERLDAAFLAVWVTAVFTTLFSSYYLTIRAISRLFRLRDQKMLSLFILPFLFVLAMIPQNILHMYEIIVRVGQFGLLITIVYPMFLLLVAVIRRKRGRCMTVCRQSKTASLLLVFLLTIPMLTGCWDRQEIEERAVVLGIGIDTADPEEKNADEEISHLKGQIHASDTGMVKVTVQIAVPGRIPLGPGESGGGGGGKRTVWVVDAVGFTIDDAVNALQQRVSPPLFFGHLRIIVVSEAVARLGMQNLNDYFRRNPEVRRLNWMFICKQEASDIMFASPQLERVPSLYLMTTMDQAVKMGRFPNDFLGVFWNASSSKGREGFLPYVELKKEQNIQISGMAYFRGEKLVGISKPIEVPLYMGITGLSLAGGQSFVRVPGTRDYFMYQVRSRKSTKKVRILNGKPVMNVTISLEGNLLSKSNESVQLSNDVIHEIEQQLESQLLTGYQRFIADTQKKGSDIFGFGEYVRAKKPAYWNQHVKTKQAWQNVYKELQVEVKVNIHVRRIGMKAT